MPPRTLEPGPAFGLYSSEDGDHWLPIPDAVGRVPIRDLRFLPGMDGLIVATRGRGLWAGDITP